MRLKKLAPEPSELGIKQCVDTGTAYARLNRCFYFEKSQLHNNSVVVTSNDSTGDCWHFNRSSLRRHHWTLRTAANESIACIRAGRTFSYIVLHAADAPCHLLVSCNLGIVPGRDDWTIPVEDEPHIAPYVLRWTRAQQKMVRVKGRSTEFAPLATLYASPEGGVDAVLKIGAPDPGEDPTVVPIVLSMAFVAAYKWSLTTGWECAVARSRWVAQVNWRLQQLGTTPNLARLARCLANAH